jgi:hypothetical protein
MDAPIHPTEIHPDLTSERLSEVATLIDMVWEKTKKSHSQEDGDGPWGFGCRFFDRLRTIIRRRSVDVSWLRIVERNMHFVFTVGAVPLRFYRGRAQRVKSGYLNRRSPEMQQQLLAFGGLAEEFNTVLRVAVEASHEADHPRIVLVRQTVGTGRSEELWNMPPGSPVKAPSFRKPPVPIAPPKVSPKATPKKRSGDNDGA